MARNGKVSDKKIVFAHRYLANGKNATEAATFAGYSAKTAYSQGQRLLKDVEVKSIIKKGLEEVLTDLDELKVKWLNEVSALAFSDFRKVAKFDREGVELISSDQLDDDTARAIESVESSVSYSKDGQPIINRKVKLHSKTKGLDTLGKFLGMLQEEQAAGVTIIINGDEAKLG